MIYLRKFKKQSCTVSEVCCLGNKKEKKKDNKINIHALSTKTRGANKKIKDYIKIRFY